MALNSIGLSENIRGSLDLEKFAKLSDALLDIGIYLYNQLVEKPGCAQVGRALRRTKSRDICIFESFNFFFYLLFLNNKASYVLL